ncbi:MAG: 6,7-dimethyl-8-ribityllumazine synthase [Candidatus Poseidoniia archaeon]|nr:6,7-dimethyl-8-ribityllumazine synthase [Candidatus Poseidoniia archaeon]
MTKSVAIVAGSYHKDKIQKMVEIVKTISVENKLLIEEICWVPGSMEIPLQVKRLLLRESIQGVIVLGIIEKGETDHGLVMGQAVTKSIIDLQLLSMKPIGFGIIGPGAEEEQIDKRVEVHAKQAALAIAEMLSS